MGQSGNRRSVKNLSLTERFHFAYFGGWAITNILLLVLAYALTASMLLLTPPGALEIDISGAIVKLGVVAVVLSGCVVFLASLTAHRIAGVHLKLEKIFRAVAEGDLSTRLKFRAADRLDDVADAFNLMMSSIKKGEPPVPLQHRSDEPESQRNRRALANIAMTRQHHLAYMGAWLFSTLGLIVITYVAAFTNLSLINLRGTSGLQNAELMLNVVLLMALAFTLYMALKSAHRIAGVHVKLEDTFHRVLAGERDLVLRFRRQDKLDFLAEAFNDMMATIKAMETPCEEDTDGGSDTDEETH